MSNPVFYKDESYLIIGNCMEVHNTLGMGFLEVIYKDALVYEFQKKAIFFEREKEYQINYKEIILPRKFHLDFLVFNKIILEVKAKSGGFAEADMAQCINYLRITGCKLCLLVNFGTPKLEVKRIVL